jgi:branched-chain amino acid transport system ATP-binding protein
MTAEVLESQQPILRAAGVGKVFGGLTALRDVDMRIERGAIAALIGPNGAGKTTFFNIVAGVIEPSAGSVTLNGKRLIAPPERAWAEPLLWVTPPTLILVVATATANLLAVPAVLEVGVLAALITVIAILLLAVVRPFWYQSGLTRLGVFRSARPNDMVTAGLGRTFQNIRLFQNMTARENVQVGTHARLRSSPIDALFNTRRNSSEERDSRQRADELLAIVGLSHAATQRAGSLPYGDQRRLELARALASQPDLLLLDEPTAGMNPLETRQLMELVQKLRDEFGVAVLLIEHDMRVVMGISDRITVLDHGEAIAEGAPAEVRSNQRVIEAYLGAPDE